MPHARPFTLSRALLVGSLAVLLSSCAVTFLPGDIGDGVRPTPPTDVGFSNKNPATARNLPTR